MDMGTDKEGYLELFVKWYEDPEVLQMVKKRVARATLTTHIGNKNNSVIGNVNKGVGDMPKQELVWYEDPAIMVLKWYENPKIVQNLKEMFGPSLYEDDDTPDLPSFLSRCPKAFQMDLQLVRWSRDPDITKMLHNRWFEPLLNEDGKPQGIAFSRHFSDCSNCYETYLLEAWPTVESALAEYGIICKLDLVFRYITIKTTRTTDPDIIVKAKQLVELLSIRIPINEAIRVVKLSDMHCDIIQLGEINGLGSKFGVTPGQYSVRLGRLMHYLHMLEGEIFFRFPVTGYSEYDFQKEMIVVIGSPLRLQVIRKIMVDAIVHDVDPSPHVNAILTSSQAMMDLKDLHL